MLFFLKDFEGDFVQGGCAEDAWFVSEGDIVGGSSVVVAWFVWEPRVVFCCGVTNIFSA